MIDLRCHDAATTTLTQGGVVSPAGSALGGLPEEPMDKGGTT
ncbi:hypothetical protein AKJ08_2741 [Vulgatibacter incomptus]|uniref:Uncharacterized protein n=1 Tax=Vulgatibacter incomptus TaxID=1391653 RepID=A0A0K1PGV8_9BACT|nr:hypothetical protein AKJ08_2741 [Vulgatibacter incomptus]